MGLNPNAVGSGLDKIYGACKLQVRDPRSVKDQGLDVIQDGDEHANITGVPVYQGNEQRAVLIARELVRMSEEVLVRAAKKP